MPTEKEKRTMSADLAGADTREVVALLNLIHEELKKRDEIEPLKAPEVPRAVQDFRRIVGGLQLRYPPDPPKLFKAEAVSPSQIKLSWTSDARNVDGFRIERCDHKKRGNFVEIQQIVNPSAKDYMDMNLNSETLYRYRLRAFNILGNSNYSEIREAIASANPAEITTK